MSKVYHLSLRLETSDVLGPEYSLIVRELELDKETPNSFLVGDSTRNRRIAKEKIGQVRVNPDLDTNSYRFIDIHAFTTDALMEETVEKMKELMKTEATKRIQTARLMEGMLMCEEPEKKYMSPPMKEGER